MFLSGNLPRSSEVITSTTVWESRFTSSDFKLARMPVTSAVSLFSPADFAAAAAFASASETAAATKLDFLILKITGSPHWTFVRTNMDPI